MEKSLLDWNPLADVEPFKTMIANGWKYQDFTKMLAHLWDEILTAIGEDNFMALTSSRYEIDGELYRRGQLMIHPTGWTNLQAYFKSKSH